MKVTVVGAGIMGLSTAWALTKRGHDVTIVEQAATVPSALAASGDQHRMIRRAYGTSSGYSALITEAYDAWEEMWSDLGVTHYAPTGILCVCQTSGDEADQFRDGFYRAGTPFEYLDPKTAAARFRFLDASAILYAFYTPEGGALLCQAIAADLARWLAQAGARLRTSAAVAALDASRGSVQLAGGETIKGDVVILAAGAWLLRLRPDLARELQIYRTAVVYLEPPTDLNADWAAAPSILSVGGSCEGYVLPPVAGTGLKFGAGIMKRPALDPDADRAPEPGEGERLRDAFSPPFDRLAEYRVREVVTCAYTFTQDERFFARRTGRVLALSACSGHGYKFGAAIGRRVADAVCSDDDDALCRWLRADLQTHT